MLLSFTEIIAWSGANNGLRKVIIENANKRAEYFSD